MTGRRHDHCRRDLEDPALAERGVLAIARRWGFDDAAHFSQVFKAAYGAPPGRYRERSGDRSHERGGSGGASGTSRPGGAGWPGGAGERTR